MSPQKFILSFSHKILDICEVDIYFTAAGLFYIPAEQRLIDTMQILKQKNAEKSAEIKELWCNPMTGITP